jgi:heme exporter protein C
VALSVYIAYFLLRSNIEEPGQKARISAVYNIFAAASLLPLTLLLPRLLGGLHPGGEEGNPLDNVKLAAEFRVIFYPAVLGFLCLGLWLFELNVRSRMLSNPTHEQ